MSKAIIVKDGPPERGVWLVWLGGAALLAIFARSIDLSWTATLVGCALYLCISLGPAYAIATWSPR